MISALRQRVESPDPDVRLWSAHLDAIPREAMVTLGAFLNAEEQERAARFHFEADRQRYVGTRGLLRHLLGAELDEEPSAIAFAQSARGKPMLAHGEHEVHALRFNISHAGGWAMFAIAWEREVGIDLESSPHLREADDLSALAERILSSREFSLWHNLPNDTSRRTAFLRAWTRKEAYAKATGQGIFDQLRDVELILDSCAPQPSLFLDEWTVHDVSAPEGFVAALAIASPISLCTPHAQR